MSNNIPIIQGVAVPVDSNYGGSGQYQQQHHSSYHHPYQPAKRNDIDYNNYTNDDNNNLRPAVPAFPADEFESRRQNAPQRYQDVIWAVLFVAHLVAMVAVIGIGLQSGEGLQSDQYGPLVGMVCTTGIASVIASVCALSFMIKNAVILVQVALVFSVGTSLAIGIMGLMTGSLLMGIVGLISFALGICYAMMVWSRIPFAAANLSTALTAVKANLGLLVVALAFTAIAFGWTTLWFLGVGNALSGNNLVVVFFLFLSFYWVHQVLQNTMHVTTAGVVGTWWFVPAEASSFWSPSLTDSFCRATTYSFGSICFGSLLVAVVQALRALERYTRDKEDFQFLSCIIQCLLGCLESILEGLNRWAYVYVGLYGFSYLEAGRNVMQLFEHKGWTAIISDDLAENVLFMISVTIGLGSGIVGMIMSMMTNDLFSSMGFQESASPGFAIGFLSGFLFSSIIMSVVGSGINTVIVCYAEDPAAFQLNHPQLSSNMRQAWVKAWPDHVV